MKISKNRTNRLKLEFRKMEGIIFIPFSFILLNKVYGISKNYIAIISNVIHFLLRLPWFWKCPNTEFFLVRTLLHSDWIRRYIPYLPVFGPNAGKYRSEKTPYLDTFHALHEKCPNMKFFLVRILLYSDKIQKNVDQKKIPYLDTSRSV